MSGAADEENEFGADLAEVARLVTAAVNAVWDLQARMGEGGHEQVRDAVIELVTERSPRAKFRMIAERPELLGHEAERLLDRAADFFRSQSLSEPAHSRFFDAHLDMIKLVRAGEVDLDRVPVEPLTVAERAKVPADRDQPRTGAEHLERARMLRARGQIEEARAAFAEAVRHARAAGDAAVEGRAELGLYTLVMETSRPGRSRHQRMREHASRAEDAYRRAGDRIGERDAIVALIAVLTDVADQPNLDRVLDRLARLDAEHARWWREYATAMNAAELDRRTSGLRWCVESAHLLGDHAEYYRKMCEAKLAYLEQRAVPVDDGDSVAFQGAVTVLDVMTNGPTEEAAERLDKLVQDVEELRKYARSQALQRELSDTHEVTYKAAVLCAETLRSPEDAVDVNELNSSRALLTQAGMQQVWQRWHPGAWGETDNAEALRGLLGRFTVAPTAHNHRLLMLAFEQQRQAQERQERQLLSAAPGLSTSSPPMRTRSVRALLAEDDRVVVYSSTGSVFLITRDQCRAVGRFPPLEIDDMVRTVLARLSKPVAASTDSRDAVAWLVETLVQPVHDHTPERSRLFLVPHASLWQVPLGALGPTRLSDTRDVSYVPSLTLLARLLTVPRLQRRVERFVGFGDPDGSLPHARAEIAQGASSFTDTFTLLGEQLGYDTVMANLADADVAHLACHGVFFPEYPDFSALHLAGPAHRPEVLWYGDLVRYALNARLVVLAACHAGTGLELFGSEYVGFPGAFLAAGARCVLAPLWGVADESTSVLMRHLYTALGRSASPAAALRDAQRAMAAEPATAHPYHWAGFQLFGVP